MVADRDSLGDRMKHQYENRCRYLLPRRSYSIIRIDGKTFHSYTRGLDRPFDRRLMDDLAETARYLCENIQGAVLAYTQSDEISVLLTDFDTTQTEAWFDGNLQKIVSVAASLATARFNELRIEGVDRYPTPSGGARLALFDARVFTIPDPVEVCNYFVWRQKDAVRNSISMAAQALYSHQELHQKNSGEMQEMLWARGVNWNDYDPRCKRGTVVEPDVVVRPVIYTDRRTGEVRTSPAVERRVWSVVPAPEFTKTSYLQDVIPVHPGVLRSPSAPTPESITPILNPGEVAESG